MGRGNTNSKPGTANMVKNIIETAGTGEAWMEDTSCGCAVLDAPAHGRADVAAWPVCDDGKKYDDDDADSDDDEESGLDDADEDEEGADGDDEFDDEDDDIFDDEDEDDDLDADVDDDEDDEF